MGVDELVVGHQLPKCFREEASSAGLLDLIGAKCLIYRLTGKEISRREIYQTHVLTSSRNIMSDDLEYGMSLEEFKTIFEKLRETNFITESTLLSNLYGALDEGRRGFTDEDKLAKCLMKAGYPRLAVTGANEYFNRVDELNIGKCSITQIHSVLRSGARREGQKAGR